MQRSHSIVLRFIFALLLLAMTVPVMADSRWPSEGWRVMATQHSYSTLLGQLKSAVKENGMGVVTEAGPTEAAAKRGVDIPGNRVIGVFRNDLAVDILRLSVPAMIEAPIRFYVTENDDGTATLAWQLPSRIFAPYIDNLEDSDKAESLSDIAAELDTLFADIAQQATEPSADS